jgi:putative SOS response-associated peptidase YedK
MARFGIHRMPEDLEPPDFQRYNAAPTQMMPVVTVEDGERGLERMRWGLVPSWAGDLKIGSKLINACGETVAEKPAFRAAFRRRRCVVPASAFCEWIKTAEGKQPLRISRRDGGLFGMAGIWEEWRGSEGRIRSFSILTTTPNELMAGIHHRMPVILSEAEEAWWLDAEADVGELRELLRPCPSGAWVAEPVNRAWNRVGFEGPACLEPAPALACFFAP